jgi:penicillin amidase
MHMARWLKRGAVALLVLIVLAFGTGWWLLHGSLATLNGEIALPGLSAPVSIDRDALGVVTIHAANETDAMRALGYVHAQERFFEMDLLRRSAAGELSELFGKIALDVDKQHRVHRLRARALDNLLVDTGEKLPLLKAYTDGINSGLADLKVRPWPYVLLGMKPEPWHYEDTILAGDAMFFDLQGGTNERELALWRIKKVVPEALYKLIAADGTEWDAPLEGVARGNVALPDATTLDLRKLPAPGIDGSPPYVDPNAPGSNNFAVSGALTKDGRAIVADDMHLGLRVPDIWFRARLLYADSRAVGGNVDVSGFTLPGVPGVIVGSNTHVAWGFTNGYTDTADWGEIFKCGDSPPRYAFGDTCEPLATYKESIRVAGHEPVTIEVRESFWGPILHDLPNGNLLSLRWAAHLPGSINLQLMGMAMAKSTADALAIADRSGIPSQNLLVADSAGKTVWRLIGALPAREPECDPQAIHLVAAYHPQFSVDVPRSKSCLPWGIGFSMPFTPIVTNRLWTANNRTLDGDALKTVGDSGYALGARAKQIRDDLFAKNQFTEKDLLAIQLDDRSLFLERWWKQLRTLVQSSNDPVLQRIEATTRHWDERASTDAVSYRIVRAWRLAVLDRIQQGLMAPAQVALGKDFVMPNLDQLEGVAWELVTQRLPNLLPRKFESWDALLVDAAHDADSKLEKIGPLAQRRWGERNTAAICHPLAGAMPSFIKHFLCMPADALPGDSNMPRVAASDFGASERMVVSPGHEADGIIEMPGGQSGNPLSPFWGAGHEAWVRGEPTPFLPGATTHTLRLVPAH